MKPLVFSLFIPVYNVATHIAEVIDNIPPDALRRINAVYFFDNGSSDDTLAVIKKSLQKKGDPRFHIFRNNSNYYLGGSTILALRKSIESGADFMICLHGDGQADPADLNKFIALADQDPDLDFVFGSRLEKNSQTASYSLLRLWGNHFFSAVQKMILRQKINDIGAYIAFNLKSIAPLSYWQVPHDMSYQPLLVLYLAKLKQIRAMEFPISWGPAETSNVNIVSYGLKHSLRLLRIYFFRFPLNTLSLDHFKTTEVKYE